MRESTGSTDGLDGVSSEGKKVSNVVEKDGGREATSVAVEEDKAVFDEDKDQERTMFEEGLRMRRREYEMPGSMPDMAMN